MCVRGCASAFRGLLRIPPSEEKNKKEGTRCLPCFLLTVFMASQLLM